MFDFILTYMRLSSSDFSVGNVIAPYASLLLLCCRGQHASGVIPAYR